ncbi:hypothetical protein WG66_003354 [Moniliophthora roreri]|nr:hypothetical protein WG66_003354 [Moniliophthora roreri]
MYADHLPEECSKYYKPRVPQGLDQRNADIELEKRFSVSDLCAAIKEEFGGLITVQVSPLGQPTLTPSANVNCPLTTPTSPQPVLPSPSMLPSRSPSVLLLLLLSPALPSQSLLALLPLTLSSTPLHQPPSTSSAAASLAEQTQASGHVSVQINRPHSNTIAFVNQRPRKIMIRSDITLEFMCGDVPCLPAVSFKKIEDLRRVWDDSLASFVAEECPGEGHDPSDRWWGKIEKLHNVWKHVADYYLPCTDEEFWAEFTDNKGEHMSFTAISKVLAAHHKAVQLCCYLKLNIDLIFVFDGLNCPVEKLVVNQAITFYDQVKILVQAFGFQIHQAPGEAEAELAQMNIQGLVDCVLTDDSNAFVFGTLFLICFKQPAEVKTSAICDDIYIYSSITLENDEELLLTRAVFILIILMVGGDYDKGIEDAGIKMALAMARCGFGDGIVEGFEWYHHDKFRLQIFLADWHLHLQKELHTNSRQFMSARNFKAANNITSSFPNLHILNLYLHPITS